MSVISTATQFITTILHIGWGYLFIVHLDMGTAGAAIALNITYGTNCIAQELYIHVFKKSFFDEFLPPFWQMSSFSWPGAKKFLKLGIPGTLMQCAEWWAFELLAIFAGMMGKH
jgi:Na+-driven multidrug efflux pump